jgi:excisionase family DNA binding protein
MSDLQLLTTEEVARLLRVSHETVRNLAATGALPGRKIGRAWRFPRAAVEDCFRRTSERPREAQGKDHEMHLASDVGTGRPEDVSA